MNAAVKEKWLAALRSGAYLQGEGWLRRQIRTGEEEFCCLGVLCDVAVKEGIIPPPVTTNGGVGSLAYQYGGLHTAKSKELPEEVREWAGLKDSVGYMDTTVTEAESLALMNDSGESFEAIAEAIEQYF